MLEDAIAYYHALLKDENLARATWEALTEGQRERYLFFGNRPLATVMRPRLLTWQQYELLQRGVELVVAALQRLGDALLADATLRSRIALTPQEEALLAQILIVCPRLEQGTPAGNERHLRAMRAAREHGSLPPPLHILNAPTGLMRRLGYGRGYVYDHEAPDRFSGQNYFPEGMARERYYEPTAEGREARLAERLAELDRLRAERRKEGS